MLWNLQTTFIWIAGILAVIATVIYTARSNSAQVWKDNYEAERIAREKSQKEAEEQRELKHNIASELAAEKLKTDLSQLMRLSTVAQNEILDAIREVIAEINNPERFAPLFDDHRRVEDEIVKRLEELAKKINEK
jgi:hypothetical protein